ncbi:peptidase S8/S53 domain-containing protein [Xylariaceae sp. FL0016]|nr:peptidase S8/S53 domain-containing protein [Xylariaceae sp. FL0016]
MSDQKIQVLKTYESDIFSGASIETDAYNLDSLTSITGVKSAWTNNHVQLAPVNPQSFSDDAAAGNYTVHNTTGVSKLHAMGIYGEGALVGIVDTGTFYTHPALGGGFGPGFKVAGGHDFVGDNYWPSDGTDKEPDEDPLDYQGHGTHVAGIIAGDSGVWSGVAPKATLNSYKVFSKSGGTDEATLIDAFLTAYDDGVDIITASVGNPGGWSTDAWAEVASRIVEQGVVVTISAGNSGADGAFFAASGSSGVSVLAVASVEAEKFPASPFNATFVLDGASNTTTVGYLPSTYYFPSEVADWPIRPMNFNTSDPADGCEPYANGTASLKGVIPLVRRGTCTFEVKQENLAALGAQYMLFYNNEDVLVTPGTENVDTLIGLITADAGLAIIDTVAAGGNVTADFSVNPEAPVGLEYAAGGLPSTFTEWGGTYDLQIKPDIAAPGGSIFSTYLDDTYAVMSGTSMSCPYVAGVAALYVGAHGGRSTYGKDFAKMLSRRIVASGKSLPWYDGITADYGSPAPVAQVGSGLVDAFKVVNYTTGISFEKMALNDTANFIGSHQIELSNNGDSAVTYNFSLESATGFEIAGWYELPPTVGEYKLKHFDELVPIDLTPEVAVPDTLTLQPGESQVVAVSFENPEGLGWNATGMPMYSGKVLISGSNGEQSSVPYLGLGTDLQAQMSPIYRTTYPFSVSTVAFTDIGVKSSYTFDLSLNSQDFPKIYSKIAWGAKEVRWDIFEQEWNETEWQYPPVPGENGYIGPATCWEGAGSSTYFDPSLSDANETYTYPVYDIIRNAYTTNDFHEYWWFGKLGNGSQIALGNYTMRFATLRPFGDPKLYTSWDVFDAPTIEVLGQY